MLLGYEPAAIRITGVATTGLSSGLVAVQNDLGVEYALGLFGTAPMQGTGQFLVVTYQQRQTVSGLPFTVSAVANEGQIPVSFSPGVPGGPRLPKVTVGDSWSNRGVITASSHLSREHPGREASASRLGCCAGTEALGRLVGASPARGGEGGETMRYLKTIGLVLFLALCGSLSHAATVSLPAASVCPGEDLVVPIAVNPADGVLGMDLKVAYDPSVVTPTAVYTTAFSSGMTLVWNVPVAGQLEIAIFGTAPLAGTGQVAYVAFTAVGSVGASTALTWVQHDLNEGNIPSSGA